MANASQASGDRRTNTNNAQPMVKIKIAAMSCITMRSSNKNKPPPFSFALACCPSARCSTTSRPSAFKACYPPIISACALALCSMMGLSITHKGCKSTHWLGAAPAQARVTVVPSQVALNPPDVFVSPFSLVMRQPPTAGVTWMPGVGKFTLIHNMPKHSAMATPPPIAL